MPRDKKTEPAVVDDELPALNAQEEALVEAIITGSDNTEAYRKAYEATGYSSGALKVKAHRKVAEPKIQAHLRALRAVGLAHLGLTVKSRLDDEMAFAQRAEDAGNYGASGQARDRINKLAGLYVERIMEVPAEPVDTLKEIARHQPELAASIAKEHGIPWSEQDATLTRH